MKAIGYQPSVGLKVGSLPAVGAGGDRMTYGDGSGYAALGAGFGEVFKAYEIQRENDMVADITAAKNEYDKRVNDLLYNEEKGLMYTQLANARGIGKTFEEEEKKIRTEVVAMLPKYEKAHLAFNKMADADTMRNANIVGKHSYEQKQQYRDVNYKTMVAFRSENAQRYYNDPAMIAEQLGQIKTWTFANYADKGHEWCKLAYDEQEASVVQKAIETAFANDDTQSARNIINAFGDKVSPEFLNRHRQGIVEADKQDHFASEAERIAEAVGNDITKVDAYIDGLDSYEINEGGNYYQAKEYFAEMKGTPYAWGGNGKNGIDCSSFTQQAASRMGAQIPRTADAQCRWAEENGTYKANDGTYQPQAGDLVFIVNTDPKNKTAYKGVTHVGMVTENGTIMQSGSSKGVGEVPMSAFDGKIIGYGQIASGKRRVKYSASEKEKLKNKVRANIARNMADERARISQTVNNIYDEMWDLYQAGNRNEKDFLAIANRYASDKDVYREALKMVGNFVGSDGTSQSGRSSGRMSSDVKAIIKDAIDTGEYDSEDDLCSSLIDKGASPGERREILEYYKNNEFKSYNWSALEQRFKNEIGTKDKLLCVGAKEAAKDFIREYKTKNDGRLPSEILVLDAMIKSGIKPSFVWGAETSGYALWERLGIRQAEMYNMRISKIDESENGYLVTFRDGTQKDFTEEEFDTFLEKTRLGEAEK